MYGVVRFHNLKMEKKDKGLDKILKLNDLWTKVDRDALGGNFNKWELSLDRILVTLLSKEGLGQISFSKGEEKDYEKLKSKILKIRKRKILALRNKQEVEVNKQKVKLYSALVGYEIWIRKFQQKKTSLGLIW